MPHAAEPKPEIDTGLDSLVLIARFHDLAVDRAGLRHHFGRQDTHFDEATLLRGARHVGLKAKAVHSTWARLTKTALPALARHKDGHYFVVANVDEANDKVLIHDPLEKRPLVLPRELFEEGWDRRLILFTRRASLDAAKRPFNFRWFVPELLKYRHLFGEVLLASFFIQILVLITPLFFQVVIDKVLVHRGLTTLDVLALGLIVVSVFEVILGGLRTYLFSHTAQRVDVVLGARLFDHLLRLPLRYFESRRTGDSVARVRELENIRNFLTGSALTLVIDLFFTVVFLAVMYYYAPTLTYIVLASIPCYVILSLVITPLLKVRVEEKFQRGAENQAFLVESVTGVETIKAMAVEPQLRNRWEEQLAGYVKSSFSAQHIGNIASQSARFINKVVTVACLWFGARLVISGELSVGQLIAFNMLASRVSSPVLRLTQLWQDFQQARISVERLGDILNTPAEPGYNPNRATLPALQGRIQFDNVTFRYRSDGPETLRRVSLDLQPGEVVGLVGRSGSGKSTLTKLVQRLYVPESGRVLVDGVDLALVEPAWLRRQVGVVLQENVLFNRSVRENVALADPAMPMEKVIEAAKLAGAHDFILELPEGYDTLVGERGTGLSGGQRQRIAIARALSTDPRILIFDEATSALDYESERIIQENLRAICDNRTVLIIAHRLSTVRDADRIVVLDKGEIVEQGNHQALIDRNGAYAKLHRYQTGEERGSFRDSQGGNDLSDHGKKPLTRGTVAGQ